jgi:hypothetical protein
MSEVNEKSDKQSKGPFRSHGTAVAEASRKTHKRETKTV